MKKEEFASGCGTAGTRISRTSKNPEVNAYLDAELALCRMMQQICKTLTDGIEIKVPEI